MLKRGMSPVMWLIVVSVLFLIVLVVLGVIFGTGVREFTKGTKECSSRQGECLQNCPPEKRIFGAECPNNQVCCLKI